MKKIDSRNIFSELEFSNYFFQNLSKKVDNIILLSIENLEIRAKSNSDEIYSHFLYNAYSEYKISPNNLEIIMEKYVNGSKTLYEKCKEINFNRIFPVIKDKSFIIDSNKTINNFEENHLYENYNSELFIFYVEDLPNTINYLKEDDLKKLNLDYNQIKELAISNLNQHTDNIERNGDDGLYMLIADGNYEASLILLDIWNNENFPVNGDIIIAIPSRDLIFITGSNDFKNIEILKNRVKEIYDEGIYITSDKLFIFNNVKFEAL